MGMREIIRCALLTKGPKGWGLPLLFWGPPGTGKSDICEASVEEFGEEFPIEVLSPGERGEGAFGVVPVPVETDGAVFLDYPMPRWCGRFAGAGAGLVFVDELTTAPPALHPPLLGLAHAHRIGGGYLGPRVRVVAAANPPEQAAAGYDLPAPLANRFVHLTWNPPTAQEWATYEMAGGAAVKPDGIRSLADAEKAVDAAWPAARAWAVGMVVAFTTRRQDLLHKMPDPTNPAASRAWPSHRTWDLAIRALAGARIHQLSAVDTDRLLAGCVGDGAAAEFQAFRHMADLPDPEALIDGKVTWAHDKTRLDRTHAVAASLSAFIVPKNAPNRDIRAERVWGILADVMKAGDPGIVYTACLNLIQAGLAATGKNAETAMLALSKTVDAAQHAQNVIAQRSAEAKRRSDEKKAAKQ